MRFRDDQRGVTVQVGAVLLLGIIVISLSIYQIQVVPAQNEQVEFDHSQAVQSDMQQVRNAILGTAATGSSRPTAVKLGMRYPARTLFVNPPPASGSIRTADAGEFTIENAAAVKDETGDYWDGSTRRFDTSRLVYSPDYAVYDNAPTTTYANSVVYNQFDSGRSISLSGQRLIDGNTVRLVALDGELSTARSDAVSIDPQAVSASTRTVAVQSTASDPLTVTVPTTLGQSTWDQLLEDETDTDGSVEDATVDTDADTLTVTLKPGVYELRLAKVGVGTNVGETSATYLTTVDAPESTGTESTQEFTVEVRDGYDNPVSGVTVEAQAGDGSVTPSSKTTDEEGRVTYSYEAPSSAGTDTIKVSYSGFSGDDTTEATYDISVNADDGSGDGSGTGDSLNPASSESGAVRLVDATLGDTKNDLEITFDNTGTEDRTLDRARIAFFYYDRNNNKEPDFGELESNTADELGIGDDFEPVNADVVFSPGEASVNIVFEQTGGGGTPDVRGAFFILQAEYEETSEISTYFVAVPN
jgi:hypothetical protein